MIWDFKGEEGNSQRDRAANVWQTNACWAIFNKEHREDFTSFLTVTFYSNNEKSGSHLLPFIFSAA